MLIRTRHRVCPTGRRPIESLERRCFLSAGDLDPTFDTDGKVVTDISLYADAANDVAIAPDGGIVLAGSTGSFLLAKYLPDGSFDSSFGTGGKVSRPNSAGPAAIAVQPDGRIVAVGSAYTSELQPRARGVVYRFNADGTPDTTFDNDGSRTFLIDTSRHTDFYAIALQSDGRIVAVGSETRVAPSGGGISDWVVARFNPDGSLDPTFSGDGWTTIGFPGNGNSHTAHGVAIEPDGKVAVTGSVSGSPAGVFSTGFAVARLTSAGELDASFDGDGRAVLAWGPFGSSNSSNSGQDIVALPDGKLLVSGRRSSRPAVYRLNANGSPDTAFGGAGDGAYVHPAGGVVPFVTANDLAVLPDGHIVLAGGTGSAFSGDMAALALTADGTPDTAFGAGGVATADFGNGELVNAVAVQADGKIVLAGRASTLNDRVDIVLARLEGFPLPPAITGAYVAGDSWSPPFRRYLEDHALGSASLGYAVPGAPARTIPWINIKRLSLTFSGSPGVVNGDLSVRGADGSSYDFIAAAFRYNALTRTATWVFDRALPNDRLEIDWVGSGPGVDLWLDVLPGDADGLTNRVNAADQGYVKARLNRGAADPVVPAGVTPYSIFADVNADGRVNAADQGAVKARLNDALPAVSPPAAAPLQEERITVRMFGESAILG